MAFAKTFLAASTFCSTAAQANLTAVTEAGLPAGTEDFAIPNL